MPQGAQEVRAALCQQLLPYEELRRGHAQVDRSRGKAACQRPSLGRSGATAAAGGTYGGTVRPCCAVREVCGSLRLR
ncbi:hypothetical protein [uncultured Desulfovibrio sp.]|uniref:hypothetical protein n=1 Tax=uncultured Desulfovibrio sp. TaxID=167968 RepID=UPI0034365BD7